jgi:hypothetical protein
MANPAMGGMMGGGMPMREFFFSISGSAWPDMERFGTERC